MSTSESVWADLKRGLKGVYLSMSAKHLDRYLRESCELLNTTELGVLESLAQVVPRMVGYRLTCLVQHPHPKAG